MKVLNKIGPGTELVEQQDAKFSIKVKDAKKFILPSSATFK